MIRILSFQGGVVLVASCVSTGLDRHHALLTTERMSFSIRAVPPLNSSEPELFRFPTYESWEYRLGSAERAASLDVRVYHDRDGNGISESDDAVVSELKETFSDPRVKTISQVVLAGQKVPVREITNVDGGQYTCEFAYGAALVSIALVVDDERLLPSYQKMFLDFVGRLSLQGA